MLSTTAFQSLATRSFAAARTASEVAGVHSALTLPRPALLLDLPLRLDVRVDHHIAVDLAIWFRVTPSEMNASVKTLPDTVPVASVPVVLNPVPKVIV